MEVAKIELSLRGKKLEQVRGRYAEHLLIPTRPVECERAGTRASLELASEIERNQIWALVV